MKKTYYEEIANHNLRFCGVPSPYWKTSHVCPTVNGWRFNPRLEFQTYYPHRCSYVNGDAALFPRTGQIRGIVLSTLCTVRSFIYSHAAMQPFANDVRRLFVELLNNPEAFVVSQLATWWLSVSSSRFNNRKVRGDDALENSNEAFNPRGTRFAPRTSDVSRSLHIVKAVNSEKCFGRLIRSRAASVGARAIGSLFISKNRHTALHDRWYSVSSLVGKVEWRVRTPLWYPTNRVTSLPEQTIFKVLLGARWCFNQFRFPRFTWSCTTRFRTRKSLKRFTNEILAFE